jgi:DNA repair protein RecN (Recombination protein N)
MLRTLHVRNLAVLADVEVEFGAGLNVLTGETGAGKSIVVDSLALLAGGRASTELIRAGAGGLSVAGVFAPLEADARRVLEAAGLDASEDQLVVRREVHREAANRVFVNDQPVTLRLLGELTAGLLRIHTQREELGLLTPEVQRAWLDRSGGGPAAELVERVAAAYHAYRDLARRLERVSGDERQRRERLDLLRFQAGEIDAAALTAGEEDDLRRQRAVLRHAEVIGGALGAASGLLLEEDDAAAARVARAQRQLEEVVDWLPEAAAWLDELEEVRIRLQELAVGVRERLQGVEADPRRLDRIEERLARIEPLLRKYGGGSEQTLALRERLAVELETLDADAEGREELQAGVGAALGEYGAVAAELSKRRGAWGRKLSREVHRELGDLAMAKARFSVRLERQPRDGSPLRLAEQPVEFSQAGYDRVGFQLAANPGEPAGPLGRVASGGELSRIYLALQLAARGSGEALPATLIFDEVDAGIGGAEAAALGTKLQRLSRGGQILVVTHLPQVASHAARHLRVIKRHTGERTEAAVETLDADRRVREVARMLAGRDVTDLSLSHARELIAVASGEE